MKGIVDIWFPGLGLVGAGIWIALWPNFNVFGSAGFAAGVNGLLQALVGFFITSLAAVATFSGATYKIDDPFDGEPALLGGNVLTRRQFLCLLFAYLALASLVLYFVGIGSIAAASTLTGSLNVQNRMLAKIAFAAPYVAVLTHVFGTTLIGLTFLSGRVPGNPMLPKRTSIRRNVKPAISIPPRNTTNP